MKKCPFCKADIEENARFCLYCMKPLNKKEIIPPSQRKPQWWLFVLAAVLMLALAMVVLLLLGRKESLPPESTGKESSFTAQIANPPEQTIGDGTQDPQGDVPPTEPSSEIPDNMQIPTQNQNTQQPTEVITPESEPETPTPEPVTPSPEPSEPEETTESTEEPPEPEAPVTQVVYTYRLAQEGDDFNAQYQNGGNDIVITGIAQPSDNGVYDIPAYIDGKKVIAITANAFYGSNTKVVYIPTTVKTIWNYAFYGCSLTDIYFRGNSIYTESKAFDRSITIHCSASCSDRNFRYYKDNAANYGATWVEWNG